MKWGGKIMKMKTQLLIYLCVLIISVIVIAINIC